MRMDERLRELRERISGLTDEELLSMVEVEFDDYRKEAIDFAKAELTARGIEFEDPSIEEEGSSDESAEANSGTERVVTCGRCSSETRPGVLLGEKEITIFFTDNDEQRFVEVYACSQCGEVQMVVDFETEIDDGRESRAHTLTRSVPTSPDFGEDLL